MDFKLLSKALISFLSGVVLVGMLLFLPAGTFIFFNAWLLILVLFVPMMIIGIVLFVKNPYLLKIRLDSREKMKVQQNIVKACGIMFCASFIVAGLAVRFGWYILPRGFSVAAAVVFLGSYILYTEVLRENTYVSRTIKVTSEQKIIDTGLYRIIRHPMYLSTVLMFLSMPLVLGSIYSFVILLIYPFLIIKRIKHEETILEKELEGYIEYTKKVKYRLIPYIW